MTEKDLCLGNVWGIGCRCGHRDSFDAFQPEGYSHNKFRCPSCGSVWSREECRKDYYSESDTSFLVEHERYERLTGITSLPMVGDIFINVHPQMELAV